MRKAAIVSLGVGLLFLAGCGTTASRGSSSGVTPISKAEKVASVALHKTSKIKLKLTFAKLITNPYRADKSLPWPAKIIVVTYAGRFAVAEACPTKTTCAPLIFDSATVVIDPATNKVLETSEPGWSKALGEATPTPGARAKVSPSAKLSPKASAKVSPTAKASAKAKAS